MTGPIRSLVGLVGLAALTCALTACSGSSVGGTPAPASSAPSRSAAQSNTPLAGLSPCKMLDQALAGQGYPASTPDTADPEHACDTVKPGYGTLGVNLQDGQSYNSHLGDAKQTQEGHVRNRRAVLSKGILQTSAGCEVSMEVKPNSRAIVDAALSSGTLDQACTDARKLAEEVDLLLPKSS